MTFLGSYLSPRIILCLIFTFQKRNESMLKSCVVGTQVSQQMQQRLKGMSKQQLIEFLKAKGQDEKKAQLRFAYELTKDTEDLENMPDNLRVRINAKNRKIEQVSDFLALASYRILLKSKCELPII